jgi:hypothetical protein
MTFKRYRAAFGLRPTLALRASLIVANSLRLKAATNDVHSTSITRKGK